ncbi:DUF4097 domain-containing protein [Nonomuraea turkmeniaca]|uniref:DUF4097 domain-containing protein n=1 Tax=Nonomuraea turkmeniaca TaxID=103838 RepID=A0A5S4EUK9_9ACTN|nr:DUF4097 family beta strand repeat-containing protein [Nonomuraea turkmeniaca]TMR04290.1 DUF4097 domain-containing protein [Nonomuraea turkmeniaca]
MPTFDTPEPISARIDLPGGEVRIIASDRTDTVVAVRHDDDGEEAGVHVGYVRGSLVVKGGSRQDSGPPRHVGGNPVIAAVRQLSRGMLLGGCASVQVTIELPSGSHVHGQTMEGEFHGSGRLGECRLRTDYGDIRLEHTGTVDLTSDSGEISVERVAGHAEITTASGEIVVHEIDGSASIRNDDGESHIGDITGDLRLIGVNGDMSVDRARGAVEAKSVHGSVRIGEVARGSVVLTSSTGDLEVGIRPGTAAWLDASTANGSLRSSLDPHDSPEAFDEVVEVRARSHDGDIVIRRA